MRIRFDFTVKPTGRAVWIALCLSLLQAGIVSLAVAPELSAGPLLALMLILSFPTSLAPVMAFGNILGAPINRISAFSIMWFCMFLAGYLQWFVLIPWLARPRLTVLSLLSVKKRPSKKEDSRNPKTGAGKRLRHLAPAPAHYDADGLSPLERVMNLK